MTGKERHADSLSGGESFMAALSLALGLADVVQADLGGLKLDSVIIDEGFGALDDTNLEACARLLTSLKRNFKNMLVISHVDSIKDIVDNVIEISHDGIDASVRY
jgi:exonuclease SbcC